ncbi:IgGFc-binding protein-like [Mytilus californianus]|uniref:IgGFc-binding protein-like n=1 Tax=Mytilus californianus TaxID=6549 RepID=UPI00224501AD|nr:IgGFc-binding protein-like [Mytilus californianus]
MNICFVLLFLSLAHERVEGNAVKIDTVKSKQGDPLSIPLIDNGGAPLVAMLDTSSMNMRIKSFIKTLMGKMIEESLTEDSTTDIIRNITKQELNEELVNVVITHVSFREQIQNIVKETLKQNSTFDLIRNIIVQELDGQLIRRNQSEEKVISDSDQDVKVDNILRPIAVTETIGETFYLGFLESNGKRGNLFLYILSRSDGSCQILIPNTDINTTIAVASTSVNSYRINPDTCMDQIGIQRKAVFVKCDVPVSVYGLTFLSVEVDGFLVLPYEFLGKDYIITSFTLKTPRDSNLSNSNFGIIAISKSTNITITFRMEGGIINYKDSRYGNDDTLHIHLSQFDTFYLSHDYDMSGTLISASNPVAVMSGVRTSYLRNGYGNHMEEMILPNDKLGRNFIVPKLYDSQCNFRIFAQEQTRVRAYDSSLVDYINIKRGFKEYENYIIYTLQSSAPVQVQLYCNGASSSYDAFMVTLPSIQQFKSSYKFPVVNDFKSAYPPQHFYITIIIQSYAKAGLCLDDEVISNYKGTTNITFDSTPYSVLAVELSVGPHEIKQQNEIPFGLLVYGRTTSSGYGFPAGFATMSKP